MPISKPALEITTSRLRLIRPTPDMAAKIFAEVDADRERLGRFLPWVPYVKSIEDEKAWIENSIKEWEDDKNYTWCIFNLSDNAFIGPISIFGIKKNYGVGEIGYWLVAKHEGRGFMSEAVKAIETELFGKGFNRIQILCSTQNNRSAAIPKRLGYIHEGTMRQDHFAGGVFHDSLIFSKLKQEWAPEEIKL